MKDIDHIIFMLQYLIMIYKHKFVKSVFLDQKQIRPITPQQPLIFILQQQQFLHYTIKTCMHHLNIPHIIKCLSAKDLDNQRKNMGHEVPTLIFANQVLETNQLVQFLCDAFLEEDEMIDFQTRKAYIKQLALTWKQIFIHERLHPHKFEELKNLGVYNKRSYQNFILQQLHNLSTSFYGRNLKKAFQKYSDQLPNLQEIIFVDIIECIVKKTPQSFVDYYLRGWNQNLIQLQSHLKIKIERAAVQDKFQQRQVILEFPQKRRDQNWDTFRLNHKRFAILFGFMATIYSVFAKS